MGSYNITCFASKHTISYGEKTYLIPIYQKSTQYPINLFLGDLNFKHFGISDNEDLVNTYWNYAGSVLESSYNDYGQFNLVNSFDNITNLTHFFNILHEKLFKVIKGEDYYNESSFDFQSIYNPEQLYSFEELSEIWNQMWAVSQENRLFINHKDNPKQLQFATFHHKSFDFFDNYSNQIKQGNNNLRSTFDSFVIEQNCFTIRSIKEMKKFPDMKGIFTHSLNKGADIISNLNGMPIGNTFHYWPLYNNKAKIIEIINEFVDSNPNETQFNQEILDKIWSISSSVINYRKIHLGLSHLNIQLTPIIYGGQDTDNTIGNSYLKFINSVNK